VHAGLYSNGRRKVRSFSPTIFIVTKSSNKLGLVQVLGLIMHKSGPEQGEDGSAEYIDDLTLETELQGKILWSDPSHF